MVVGICLMRVSKYGLLVLKFGLLEGDSNPVKTEVSELILGRYMIV